MPKFYCDYCDTHLTHDSPSVRKTHCNGRKHRENVKVYYQNWMEEQVILEAFSSGAYNQSRGGTEPGLRLALNVSQSRWVLSPKYQKLD